jgi:hypothetical protein
MNFFTLSRGQTLNPNDALQFREIQGSGIH